MRSRAPTRQASSGQALPFRLDPCDSEREGARIGLWGVLVLFVEGSPTG